MSAKLVTSRQGQSVVDMANDKDVSREEFQRALDNGNLARFLDSIKLVPLKDSRILTFNLLVNGIEEEVILLEWITWRHGWDCITAWRKRVGLKPVTLSEVYSIGEQNPKLMQKLYDLERVGPQQIVATKSCPYYGIKPYGIRGFDPEKGWIHPMDTEMIADGRAWLAFRK